MNRSLQILLAFLISSAAIGVARADDYSRTDDLVATGIVFKIIYVATNQGPWSDLATESNPEPFKDAWNSIRKDLTSFSNEKHGQKLRQEGERLLDLIEKGVLTSLKKDNTEFRDFLTENGLEADVDVEAVSDLFSKRIADYAKLSKTPEWVVQPPNFREVSAEQPATAQDSKPKRK